MGDPRWIDDDVDTVVVHATEVTIFFPSSFEVVVEGGPTRQHHPLLNWSVSACTFVPICFPFGIPWRCHAFSASCRKPVRRGLVKSQKIWRHECSSAGDEPEIDAQPFLVHLYVALHHRSWWCHRYGSARSRHFAIENFKLVSSDIRNFMFEFSKKKNFNLDVVFDLLCWSLSLCFFENSSDLC